MNNTFFVDDFDYFIFEYCKFGRRINSYADLHENPGKVILVPPLAHHIPGLLVCYTLKRINKQPYTSFQDSWTFFHSTFLLNLTRVASF